MLFYFTIIMLISYQSSIYSSKAESVYLGMATINTPCHRINLWPIYNVMPFLFTIPILIFACREKNLKYAHKSKYVYKQVLKKLIDVINNILCL